MKTRNLTFALACAVIGRAVAYDPGKAGWKKDADGKLVLDSDGNPIYLDTNGAEKSLAADTVSRLNGEAKGFRERAEAAEAAVKAFGDFKPEQVKPAIAALQTVKDLKDGDLIKAGEAERVRNEIKQTYETQLGERDKKIVELGGTVSGMRKDNAFRNSKYVADNIAVPIDMLTAVFGNNFKDEDGRLVAYDALGQKIISKKKGGEYADFDEALSIMVDNYSHKDAIMKGTGNSGSGNNGNGGTKGGGRLVRRADFDAMPGHEQASIAAKANAGELQIVD